MDTFSFYQTQNISVQNDILSFMKLPEDWDYGIGIPATPVAVASSLTLLGRLANSPVFINVFPQTNGGITFHIWKKPQDVIEVRVSPDVMNQYDFMHEQEFLGAMDIAHDGENLTLKQLVSVIWKLLGLSTSGNITKTYSDSPRIVSKTTVEEFRFSINNAQNLSQIRYVSTLGNTTHQPQETQSRSGLYPQKTLRIFATT
jgi:hypothetical protein